MTWRRTVRRVVRRAGSSAALGTALILFAPSMAFAVFSGSDANTNNSVSAGTDIVGPPVGAATTAKSTGGMAGHIRQSATYEAYADVTDAGSPATGIASVTADLSAITAGQTSVAYSTAGGPFAYSGTTYSHRTATLTADASLPQCRYAYPLRTTDVAGNTTRTDQRVMVDKRVVSQTYLMRVDGPTDSAYLGYDSLGGTGDVNGDGKADFVAGSDSLSYNGRGSSGSAFVVFGQASQNTIDSSALGGNGYRIDGASANDSAGYKVGNAGDVNGDGKSDTLVVARGTDNNGRTDSGSAYVVFGKATTTTVDLANLGTGGFRIDGAATGDDVTNAVTTGDVNGDGKADVLVDADDADNNGRTNSGSVYVVFGQATTTTIDLAGLGAGGYRIDGPTSDFNGGGMGFNLDGGRDVNGDGIPDAVLASYYSDNNGRTDSGSAYVVFGKTSTTTIDLAALGGQGYRIDGQSAGDELSTSIGLAPDMNGDGKAELVLGAQWASYNGRTDSGSTYVVFGKATTTAQDLASLGAGGYRIDGASANDESGFWAYSPGDVNDDGIADVLIGAPYTGYNGTTESGSVYVVFGKTSNGTIDLSALGAQGYRFDGVNDYDYLGEGLASVGDVDGDGRADLLMAADNMDTNGYLDNGSVYVVSQPWCSYRQAVMATSGLQSYWRLGESSGTSAADSKGAVTGTYSAGYTLGATGGTGDGNTAIGTSGTSPVVTFGDNYDFTGFGAFSAEAWIKPSAFALDGTYRRIIGKDGGSPTEGWDIAISPAGGVAGGIGAGARQVSFERWSGGSVTRITGPTVLTTGRWYHVVATSDATTMTLYVNGQAAISAAVGGSLANTTNPLYVGSGTDQATVDDVSIYNTALTAADVQRHYTLR